MSLSAVPFFRPSQINGRIIDSAFTVAFNLPAIFEHEVYITFSSISIASREERLFTQTVDVGDHLEVAPTALRFNEVYVKMYKLMAEFLVRSRAPQNLCL